MAASMPLIAAHLYSNCQSADITLGGKDLLHGAETLTAAAWAKAARRLAPRLKYPIEEKGIGERYLYKYVT
jgi:hypothetical protein